MNMSRGNTSDTVKAAQAVDRINKLRAKRDEELASAPQSISERYAAKESKELDRLDPGVRSMAERLLDKDD